jgi:hypothetical protein
LIGQNRNGGGELVPSDDPGEIAESEESSGGYFYFALRPVRHDEEGKVLELAIWLVACGPLPEAARPRSPGRGKGGEADEPSVTDHPFPGLEVAESNCVAENVEALRGAAVLSEHLGDPLSFHWVRDGWR